MILSMIKQNFLANDVQSSVCKNNAISKVATAMGMKIPIVKSGFYSRQDYEIASF